MQLSITGDSACRALYNNHMLNPRAANKVLPLAVCPELSENSRLEFESECAPTKLGPSRSNLNSTLRMLKYGQSYVDKGSEYYEHRYRNQQLHTLRKQAAKLGLQITTAV